MSQELEMILRLLLAAALGLIIGLQREWKGKQAGVRALPLISVGSALLAIISEMGFIGSDPSRIASGVVTGIGFLGVGAILHRHGGVEGLTTAAAIWATAGIGLAVGAGLYLIALIVAAITLAVLFSPHIPSSKNVK
ncbi:MAG: MgtC/SapB family protein [Thermodesulfobacteriota bacterium]|jgi:putative Mg2+ transporter-C (MgtC) family protein